MPLPNVAVPTFPNIPKAPGVPPLLRVQKVVADVALVVADALILLKAFQGPQWGVFTPQGEPVLIGDSVVSVGLKKDYRISNFPVEKGAFASYNKVEMPFDARLTFTVGGSDDDRAQFLGRVQKACGSLALYSVVMPELTYASANLTRFDFERRAKAGVTLLSVDVWLEEVRIAVQTSSNQKTAEPAGAKPEALGPVQATSPTPEQIGAAKAVT